MNGDVPRLAELVGTNGQRSPDSTADESRRPSHTLDRIAPA